MNIKVFIGEILKKTGVLNTSLYISSKLGYLSKFTDHHANGIDLKYDIKTDIELSEIRQVIDVGASIGTMTDYFLSVFPNCIVEAIEPYGASYKTIEKKYLGNGRVRCHKIGFAEKPGETKMFIQADSGYNSLHPEVNKPSDKMDGIFEVVQVETIDNFCNKHAISKIDFLKIDTEGMDLHVLKGAEGLLKERGISYIFVECTFERENIQNTLFDNLRDYLSPFGFKLRAIYDQSNYGEKTYLTCVNAMFMLQ